MKKSNNCIDTQCIATARAESKQSKQARTVAGKQQAPKKSALQSLEPREPHIATDSHKGDKPKETQVPIERYWM